MDNDVESYEDARRRAAGILAAQRGMGIHEIGAALTPEEALVKARLLLALGTEEVRQGKKQTRCVGSVPHISSHPEGKRAQLALSHAPGGPADGRAAFVGDKVSLHPDPEYVKACMLVTPQGWNDLIGEYAGKVGRIVKIISVQSLVVAFHDTNTWVLPAVVLVRGKHETDEAIASPKRVKRPAEGTPGPFKALLCADTLPGLEDCRTAWRYINDDGFSPWMGVKIVGPDSVNEDHLSGVRAGLHWLCDGVGSGDSLFLMLSHKLGSNADGIGSISGEELLQPLRTLPSTAKLTCVVGAHCCGGGGALLDLPYTLSSTRDGGIQAVERPLAAGIVADVVTIGTWAEAGSAVVAQQPQVLRPFSYTHEAQPEEVQFISCIVRALSVAHPPTPEVFVKDLRETLRKRCGHSAPLPKLAGTRELHKSKRAMALTVEFTNMLATRVPDTPHVTKDHTSLAAARLCGPSQTGKCVPLGDAEARAWVIFASHNTLEIDDRTGSLISRVAVYNGHPCFVLEVYNWVDNDDVTPLGDTTIGPHHSKEGLVYKLSVVPGETKQFLEGHLKDGEGWRPGWRQSMIDEKVFAAQRTGLRAEMARSHAKTQAVLDVLALKEDGGDQPDSAFSSVSLLDSLDAVNTSQGLTDRPEHQQHLNPNAVFCSFYDMWFPPNTVSLGESLASEASTSGDDIFWGRQSEYAADPYEVHDKSQKAKNRAPPPPPPILPQNPANILPNDITQGKVKNTKFLCAVAAAAERPGVIQSLFSRHKRAYLQMGAVRMQLCVKGWWQDVTVDSYLPLVRRPITSVVCTPAGAHNIKRLAGGEIGSHSLWPSFVEKGMAKVCGSYEELVASNETVVDFLKVVTGCVVMTYPLVKHSTAFSAKQGAYGGTVVTPPDFEKIVSWLEGGDLLVLFPKKSHSQRHETDRNTKLTQTRPRQHHAYPVVQYNRQRKTLCVRDVWSSSDEVWEGEVRAGCPEPPMRLSLDEDEVALAGGDTLGELGYEDDVAVGGGRWVHIAGLHQMFSKVARVRPPIGGELRVWLSWSGRYPVFLLRVEVQVETTFHVTCSTQHTGAQAGLTTQVIHHSASGQLQLMETFSGPFEISVHPQASPLYLAVSEPPPCEEGAVMELLYRYGI